MSKYRVLLADDRTLEVLADDESSVLAQAEHAERTRFIVAVKRGQDPGANPSSPVSFTKIKN
jgi:hypothetical protein